jgi:hypothetical protein
LKIKEGKMRLLNITLLAFSCLAVPMSLPSATAQERKVTRVQMTIDELAAQGIAVLLGTKVRSFPNSCRSSGNARLSVSSGLLGHFRAQGFTLESLCLGLSSNILFDPETGRQLPLAFVPEIRGDQKNVFPLNLPSCFRNAVSYLECDNKFHTYWGSRWDERERTENRKSWQQFDVTIRQKIQRDRISGIFKWQAIGDVLKVPASTEIELLLASSVLPRGYGYALHGPEGDDPEVETVNLSTYRKRNARSPFWND